MISNFFSNFILVLSFLFVYLLFWFSFVFMFKFVNEWKEVAYEKGNRSCGK